MSGPASLKPEEENLCNTASQWKALRTRPLTSTVRFKFAYDNGKHKMESKMSLDFENLSISPSSFVKWDNTSFPI